MCVCGGREGNFFGFITHLPFFVSSFFFTYFHGATGFQSTARTTKIEKRKGMSFYQKMHINGHAKHFVSSCFRGLVVSKKNMEKIHLCKNNWPRMCATRSTEAAKEAAAEN